MDERALRFPSDARQAGLRRLSKEEISRNFRASRIRSDKRETRSARFDDGSVRRGRRRSARWRETLGRKNSSKPKLRNGNLRSLSESEAAFDDARSAGATGGADRARAYAQDSTVLGLLRGCALASGGEAGAKNSGQRNSRTRRRLRRSGARSKDVDAKSVRLPRDQF